MDAAGYVTLTRQAGLMREMQGIAQNIANAATTGYRRDGMIFSEFVVAPDGDGPSLSMARGHGHHLSDAQGALERTGGRFDFAIEGAGYFQVETPQGMRLTRAGSFTPDANGVLVTPAGHPLLDAGGAPVFAPPDAMEISLAADGTLSADGQPLAEIAVVLPANPNRMSRGAGALFEAEGGIVPADGRLVQGFLESSNVSAVAEIARMVEVQRAYELGQTFLDREDERLRGLIQTLGR